MTCKSELRKLFDADSYSPYLDASGRPQPGLLESNTLWLGHYTQCQRTQGAKYCLMEGSVNLQKSLNMSQSIPGVKWGVCVPSECSESQVIDSLDVITTEVLHVGNEPVQFGAPQIHCAETLEYDAGFYVTICVLLLLVILCLAGTLLDTLLSDSDDKSPPKPWIRLLNCWSPRKNIGKIFRLETASDDLHGNQKQLQPIRCLDGVRVLNISTIMLGHTFLASFSSGFVANPKDLLDFAGAWWWQPVGNAYFMVYSYLCISGVLVSYHGLHLLEQYKGNFSMSKYCLHRYIRLTPSMAILLAFWVYIKPYIAEGPMWYTMSTDPACTQYWWTNLLYIQNIYPFSMEQTCTGWTWYLAMDTQLHLVGAFVLLALYRNPRNGSRLISVLAAISILLTAWIILYYEINVNLTRLVIVGDLVGMEKYESLVYGKPYCRLAPYLVGMATGYVLYDVQQLRNQKATQSNELTWKPHTAAILWVASVLTMAGCLWFWYLCPLLLAEGAGMSLVTHALYESLAPLVWAVSLAWLILACNTGYGSFISTMLSWPGWRPLSRVSYSLYLVHPIVMFVIFHSVKMPIYISGLTILMFYSAVMFLAVPLSVGLVLMVELPVANLEKYFTSAEKREKTS